MAKPTLYEALGISWSATRDEIRAAYQRQMGRVRAGGLPRRRERSIERAYAILDNPDRRLRYDLELTSSHRPVWWPQIGNVLSEGRARWHRLRPDTHLASLLTRLKPRFAKLPHWPPATRLDMTAHAIALLASICVIVLLSPARGKHTSPEPTHVATSRAGNAAATPPAELALGATVPSGVVEQSAGPPQSAEEPSQPATAPPPSSLAVPAGPPRVVYTQSTRAPAVEFEAVASDPADGDDLSQAVAAAEPSPEPQLAVPAAYVPPPVAASNGPSPSPARLALVWSRPIIGSKVVTRVGGQYCRDRSGGEIFLPVAAPVPAGLTC